MTAPASRSVDHLVLPTASLDGARKRLAALGFTVAPDGVHPFGTVNCCVYLADGTFLEPLSVADPAAADAAVADGNVFVARDAAFRRLNGEDGLSALVLKTDDAAGDDAAYRALGLSAGKPLDFARPFRDASGAADIARFRLAFAAPAGVDNAFAFTCQRLNVPAVARGALERHANGVVRLSAVVAVAAEPRGAATFFRKITGAAPAADRPDSLSLAVGDVTLSVQSEAAFAARVECSPASVTALRYAAVGFSTRDLATTRAVFQASGVAFHSVASSLVVPPAPGQGAVFVFEELS